MQRKICCFAGHGKLTCKDDINNELFYTCHELIFDYGVREFWVGKYGNFDSLAANTVRLLKELFPDVKLVLVIPYLTKSIEEYKEEYYRSYDSIIMADIPYGTPKQYQILKCNEFMVNNSNYLIAYVNYSFGGAAKTLAYAKRKKHINITNLGELL